MNTPANIEPANNDPTDTSVHVNTATFQYTGSIYPSGISAIRFNGDLVVTPGQPHNTEPTFSQDNTGTWTLTFVSGRKGDADVAKSFIQWSGGNDSNLYGLLSPTGSPGKLNFAFGTECTLPDGNTVVLYFGQGHTGAENNWWVGSTDISGGKHLASSSSSQVFSLGTDSDSSFTLN